MKPHGGSRDLGLSDDEGRAVECPLDGATPSVIHRGEQWYKPEKSAKTLPIMIERRVFPDTQITACRIAA